MSSLSPSKARFLLPPHCPAKFKHVLDNPEPPKTEWDFGELAHCLLLGEGRQIEVLPFDNYKTKAAQEAREKARAADRIPALPRDMDKAAAMVAEVAAHPCAGPLFAEGHAEYTLRAQDPETGVDLSGRVDWLTMIDGKVVIVDYKTAQTAHPATFARKAMDYGTLLQAAWYRRLAQMTEVEADPDVMFVVQSKDEPYLLSVVAFDAEAMMLGEAHMRQAIDLYAWCLERGEWPAYGDDVQTVSLPGWAFLV